MTRKVNALKIRDLKIDKGNQIQKTSESCYSHFEYQTRVRSLPSVESKTVFSVRFRGENCVKTKCHSVQTVCE